jgi:hypothetical protein
MYRPQLEKYNYDDSKLEHVNEVLFPGKKHGYLI